MKFVLAAVLIFILQGYGFSQLSQLGDSVDQLKARYGDPYATTKNKTAYGFKKDKNDFIFMFKENSAYGVMIKCDETSRKTDFSEKEIWELLKTIQPEDDSHKWEEVTGFVTEEDRAKGDRIFAFDGAESLVGMYVKEDNSVLVVFSKDLMELRKAAVDVVMFKE